MKQGSTLSGSLEAGLPDSTTNSTAKHRTVTENAAASGRRVLGVEVAKVSRARSHVA